MIYEQISITIPITHTLTTLIRAIDTIGGDTDRGLGKDLKDLFESITGEDYEEKRKEIKQDLIKEILRYNKYNKKGVGVEEFLSQFPIKTLFDVFQWVVSKLDQTPSLDEERAMAWSQAKF